MRVFHCDHCQQLVFFENTACVRCGTALAYFPDLGDIGSLEPVEGGCGGHRLFRQKDGSIVSAITTRGTMFATGLSPSIIPIGSVSPAV